MKKEIKQPFYENVFNLLNKIIFVLFIVLIFTIYNKTLLKFVEEYETKDKLFNTLLIQKNERIINKRNLIISSQLLIESADVIEAKFYAIKKVDASITELKDDIDLYLNTQSKFHIDNKKFSIFIKNVELNTLYYKINPLLDELNSDLNRIKEYSNDNVHYYETINNVIRNLLLLEHYLSKYINKLRIEQFESFE